MSKDVQDLWSEIEQIKNNHLEHIKQDLDHVKSNVERIEKTVDKQDYKLDKMDSRLWWIFTWVVGGVLSAVAASIAKMLGLF
jgi:predicted  nucleic acid-binding Zn-ribbon protein